MAGVESIGALALAEQVLRGDATFLAAVPGGILLGVAPFGTFAPVCVLWPQSAMDYTSFNGRTRIWADTTLMVKVSGPMPISGLQTAADRADALLNLRTGNAGGHTVLAFTRQSALVVPEKKL